MNLQEELKRVSDNYRDQGYDVIVEPRGNVLPAFAKDFDVDLLARRGPEGVLVQVKQTRQELSADPNTSRYADITSKQPGWRFDFVILHPESPIDRTKQERAEPTSEQLNTMLQRADESYRVGVREAAVILLWGSLEAAMRKRLQDSSGSGRYQPRVMMNELYSSGALSREEFDHLEEAWKMRTALVHGFMAPQVERTVIDSMIRITRRLIDEAPTTETAAS